MDEDEQRDVEIFLNQTDPTGANGYWIGLTDLSHEGHWMWISSGKSAEYLNWGTSNVRSIFRQSSVKIPPIKNISSNNTLHIFHLFSPYP